MLRTLRCSLIALALLSALNASANAQVEFLFFVPQGFDRDTTFTTSDSNFNDGFNTGRGIVFQATENRQINGVGVFLSVTQEPVTFTVSQVASLVGDVEAGQTVLRTGTSTVSVFQNFVDFQFAPLVLVAGQNYHIDFSFSGPQIGTRTFYRNTATDSENDTDDIPWSQDGFTQIDGTQNGDTTNFLVPVVRLILPPGGGTGVVVPEPGTVAFMGLGLLGLAMVRRRRVR
ncbi:MAG: hypothetical protein OHK0029_33470 [Armatimonadaceae bacterium]